jgi:hypothetical protein
MWLEVEGTHDQPLRGAVHLGIEPAHQTPMVQKGQAM